MHTQLANNFVKGDAILGQLRGSSCRDWRDAWDTSRGWWGRTDREDDDACSACEAVGLTGCYLVGCLIDSLPSRAEPGLQGENINIKRERQCPIGWLRIPPQPGKAANKYLSDTERSKGF